VKTEIEIDRILPQYDLRDIEPIDTTVTRPLSHPIDREVMNSPMCMSLEGLKVKFAVLFGAQNLYKKI